MVTIGHRLLLPFLALRRLLRTTSTSMPQDSTRRTARTIAGTVSQYVVWLLAPSSLVFPPDLFIFAKSQPSMLGFCSDYRLHFGRLYIIFFSLHPNKQKDCATLSFLHKTNTHSVPSTPFLYPL